MSDSSGRGWQVQAGSRCRTADPCVDVKNSHRGTETMHIERRKHPRFKVNEGRVWTGRWSSPSVFETSASLVNNLSLGGRQGPDIVGSRRRRIPLDPTGSARQLPDFSGPRSWRFSRSTRGITGSGWNSRYHARSRS